MIFFTDMNKPIWLALLGWGLRNISGLASLMCRIKALSAGPMVKLSPSHTGMQECLVGAVMRDGGCSLTRWSLFRFCWYIVLWMLCFKLLVYFTSTCTFHIPYSNFKGKILNCTFILGSLIYLPIGLTFDPSSQRDKRSYKWVLRLLHTCPSSEQVSLGDEVETEKLEYGF